MILFFIPVTIELLHDFLYIMNGESPNKKRGVLIRTLLAILVTAAYLYGTPLYTEIGFISAFLYGLFLSFSIHFVFFNYTLNKATGKPFFHLGSGPLDTIEKGFHPWHMLLMRLVLLVSVIAMYYVTPGYYGL